MRSRAPTSGSALWRLFRKRFRPCVRRLAALGDPERSPDPAGRLRELARDDPDLVRVALRDLREHLQVLIGEQLRVDVGRVDRGGDVLDRLRLPFGAEDLRRLRALRAGIALCFSPSAVRICDCFTPSAFRIAARLSRSARICFSIASWMVFGGSIAFSSTRFTRTPHFPVASSRTPRSWVLIWSREVRVSFSAM